MKLYEIPEKWANILDTIEENCGEITEALEQEMASLLDASTEKIAAAAYAKRNLELKAEAAKAQAEIFAKEAAIIKANAMALEAAADRIGSLMVPALEVTGKVKTAAGTVYTRTSHSYEFALKAGVEFFELPSDLWRQKEPELNKLALKKLADEDALPEEILAHKTEKTTVCIKTATPKERKEA